MTKIKKAIIILVAVVLFIIMFSFTQLESQKYALTQTIESFKTEYISFCNTYPSALEKLPLLPEPQASEAKQELAKLCEIKSDEILLTKQSLHAYVAQKDLYQKKMNLLWEKVASSYKKMANDKEKKALELALNKQNEFHEQNILLKFEIRTYNKNLTRGLNSFINGIFTNYQPYDLMLIKVEAVGPEFKTIKPVD